MYGCESWTIKKAEHQRIDAFELWCWRRRLESLLNCKEIQPVHPKGNQSWIFIGRSDTKAEAPILWPPDAENWLIGKDPDSGKDRSQEEKGMTEDEMVGWHHRLNGHELKQSPGAGNGLESLACCSLWGSRESDMTERLNWIELPPPRTHRDVTGSGSPSSSWPHPPKSSSPWPKDRCVCAPASGLEAASFIHLEREGPGLLTCWGHYNLNTNCHKRLKREKSFLHTHTEEHSFPSKF